MRKISLVLLLTFLCLFVLSSCNAQNSNVVQNVQYGVYSDKKWEATQSAGEYAAVPDIDTAVEIAVSIFNGIERKRIHEGQKVQYVFFDTEDEVWIVSFWKDRGYGPYAMIAEGSFNIAIQKSDAKVLRMWVG